ncbi:MAG: hypothetical protein BWY82_01635 [Verrucomicrobia bacterium ADurb.Bin474]|nr:MAG: hypothetical protein BWY82_01635 [Verrucomicrobia bacterium ADurb.Bin474]
MSPWLAKPIGRLATRIAEQVDLRNDSAGCPLVTVPQRFIGNHQVCAGQTREIVGFARRHQDDGALKDLGRQGASGDVPTLTQLKVTMDLVRAQDQIILHAKLTDLFKFGSGKRLSDRILRMAEQEKAGARAHL